MAKLKLHDYIHLLDRMLDREGLAEIERDAIFNDPTNAEMISAMFYKRTHPKEVIKELDRRPVEAMYASLRESLEELGYINEAQEIPELTPGQKYAVDFLKSKGLKLVSNPTQLRRGTLMFQKGNENEYWAIYKTGYIRKGGYGKSWYGAHDDEPLTLKMGVIDKIRPAQYQGGGKIDDDEYMELAHMISKKLARQSSIKKKENDPEYIRKKQQKESRKRVNELVDMMVDVLEDGRLGIEYGTDATEEERIKAVEKLYKKFIS